jgi:hypothetical protein
VHLTVRYDSSGAVFLRGSGAVGGAMRSQSGEYHAYLWDDADITDQELTSLLDNLSWYDPPLLRALLKIL